MLKRSKFKVNITKKGIEKRTFKGIIFDSEMELKYYRDYLIPLQEQKIVTKIILQPKYLIQEKFNKYGKVILPINYVADFEVFYADGKNIIVDIKGFPSSDAKLKRKLFDYKYPQKTLQWISLSKINGGWLLYEDLIKIRSKRKRKN